MMQPTVDADAIAPPARTLRVRGWLIHAALLLAGLALIALFVRGVDADVALAALSRVGPGALAIAVLVYAAGWVLRAWRLHLIARAAGIPATPAESARTAIGANALNVIAPARLGDVAALFALRRPPAGATGAAASILLWRLIDLAGLLFLATAALALVASARGIVGIPLGSAAIVAGALAGGALTIAALRSPWVARALDRLASRLFRSEAPAGTRLADAFRKLSTARVVAPSLALSVLSWACDAYVAATFAHAVWGAESAWLVGSLALVVANMAKTIPSTPGALGVFEAAFSGVMILFGCPAALAVAAAVATHLLMNAFTLLTGSRSAYQVARAVPGALWRA